MASFLDNNGLQKLGLLMSGIASTTSRDPRYLQTNLAMQDSFQEMKDRERMEAEREKQELLLRRLANPTSQDMIGTPQTKAFEVNGRMVGQNAPAQMQQVMPDDMRLRSLQRAMPKQFMAAELEQLLAPPPGPIALGENDRLIDPTTRKILVDAVPRAPRGPESPIGKLMADRDALPPDSPLRKFYDLKINQESQGEQKEGNRAFRNLTPDELKTRGLPSWGPIYETDGLSVRAVPGTAPDTGRMWNADRTAQLPIPGASAEQGKQGLPQAYREHVKAYDELDGTIKEYKTLLAQTGTESWNATKAQRLKSLQTQMMLGMKDVAKTGSLDDGTMKVMADLIPDATSFGANMNMFSGATKAMANADELASYSARGRKALENAYNGGTKPTPAGVSPDDWAAMTPEEKALFQ